MGTAELSVRGQLRRSVKKWRPRPQHKTVTPGGGLGGGGGKRGGFGG